MQTEFIIKPAQTKRATLIASVPEKDGTLQFCVDCREEKGFSHITHGNLHWLTKQGSSLALNAKSG